MNLTKNTTMRKNKNNQLVYAEQDIVTGWLSGHNIDWVIPEDIEPINIYNAWCNEIDAQQDMIDVITENISDNFVEQCTQIQNWNMPEEYKILDLYEYLLEKLPDDNYHGRMMEELYAYEERGLLPVLKFLIYLVDVCKENDVVLGVGRGSSVASYVLYLIGVHKVDSIKYDLDIKEFLK